MSYGSEYVKRKREEFKEKYGLEAYREMRRNEYKNAKYNKTPEFKTKSVRAVKKYKAKLIAQIYANYGNSCACCGETTKEFLTIDHINGDGRKERRDTGLNGSYQYYCYIRRQGFPKDKYRLLCFNCNCGRERNGGVCPHQSKII